MPLLIIMAGISIFVALFAMQNSTSVALSFIFMEFESSLAFVTLTSFFCGVLVAGCYALIIKYRHYRAEKKMNESIAELTKEKEKLETLVTYLKEHQGEMPAPPKPTVIRNPYIRN